MWSPSGEEGSQKYWPKSEYVDLIGISVYSYNLWDIGHLGKARTFMEVFLPKYWRLSKFDKPILIAEMGVTGSDEYKHSWLRSMSWQINIFPKIIGYVYFNDFDVESAWGTEFPTPDWRISRLDF
jgi:endoglucanase